MSEHIYENAAFHNKLPPIAKKPKNKNDHGIEQKPLDNSDQNLYTGLQKFETEEKNVLKEAKTADNTILGHCGFNRWVIIGVIAAVVVLLCVTAVIMVILLRDTKDPSSGEARNATVIEQQMEEIKRLTEGMQNLTRTVNQLMEMNDAKTTDLKLIKSHSNTQDQQIQANAAALLSANALTSDVQTLTARSNICTSNIQTLRAGSNIITNEIQNLAEKSNIITNDIQTLTEKSNTFVNDIQTLTSDVGDLKVTTSGLSTDIDSLEETTDAISATISPTEVSFSATTISSTQYTLSSGDTVPFNSQISDNGNNYNTATYEFTCPLTGYYYFIVCLNLGHLGGAYPTTSEAELRVAGSAVFDIYSYNQDSTTFAQRDQGCNAAIVRCNSGDVAYVRAARASRITGYRRSTFSGFYQHSL